MINTVCLATQEENGVEEAATEQEPIQEVFQEEPIQAEAIVIEAGDAEEMETESITDTIQTVTLEILNGEYETEEFQTDYVLSYDMAGKIKAYPLSEGDKVIVQISKDVTGNVAVKIQEIVRNSHVLLLLGLFLLSILIVCGKNGIKIICGFLLTSLVVYGVLIKGIYAGINITFVTVLTGILVVGGICLSVNGINRKALTAFLGTLGGMIVSGIIGTIFCRFAKITGASEDVLGISMNLTGTKFAFEKIMFAAICISTLGACLDIALTMSLKMDEAKVKTEDILWKRLFRKGMDVGKDMAGLKINTLLFVYLGGNLSLILLCLACNMELFGIFSKEVIAKEIVAAISGGIGIVLTIPITALADAGFNRKKINFKKTSDNKLEGKRSLKL